MKNCTYMCDKRVYWCCPCVLKLLLIFCKYCFENAFAWVIGNNYVYRQSQVRKQTGSGVEWAECLLITGTGCRVQVFSMILDRSDGLSAVPRALSSALAALQSVFLSDWWYWCYKNHIISSFGIPGDRVVTRLPDTEVIPRFVVCDPIPYRGVVLWVWDPIYQMAIRSYSALGMLPHPIIIMAHDYSHALSTINACWVYHVESVSKMGLVLSIIFLQYMRLHVLNWPIRVWVIERIYL